MRNYWLLITFLVGYNFIYLQKNIGMYGEWDGVKYYGEVHLSMWNSFIHTIFMLGTMLGFFIAIPSLFNMNYYGAKRLKSLVSMFYMGLYFRMSFWLTLLWLIWYLAPYYYSDILYKKIRSCTDRIIIGLVLSIGCLLIQEYFGHYIGGDNPSRMSGIPNAILYAQFYAVSHIFV